jgi:pyruvate dehydrogenase complex dehydrogenase (E1) component
LFASTDVIFTLWGRDWKKFLTITKNKFWKAWVNYILDIEYATSTFKMAEDALEEASWSNFKWL